MAAHTLSVHVDREVEETRLRPASSIEEYGTSAGTVVAACVR